MKPGAMLVNTAHAGFMTEEASINLLAMAFDILEEEMARAQQPTAQIEPGHEGPSGEACPRRRR